MKAIKPHPPPRCKPEPVIGIAMLRTRFPRVLGDPGHPRTWRSPVLYEVVESATVGRVARAEGPEPDLLEAFRGAVARLAAAGARGVVTSCGLLAPFQRALARASAVPVATSSLLQVAALDAALPAGRRAGVLTLDARRLSARHLAAAGAAPDTPVAGCEGGREIARAILGDRAALDVEAARADVLAAGDALVQRHAEVGAVVLECTNMAPYAGALRDRLGLPVHDLITLVDDLRARLAGGVPGGSERL